MRTFKDILLGCLLFSSVAYASYVIPDLGVTTRKLAAQAVTAAKIANSTITASQIANTTITATQIANTTVTATQIANATITGTQVSSNINLPGEAVREASSNVVVSNANETNSLSILRGQVAADGTILRGVGYTVSVIGTGTYQIFPATAFADTPVVLVTPTQIGSSTSTPTANVILTSTTSVEIQMLSLNSGTAIGFMFELIGQRN